MWRRDILISYLAVVTFYLGAIRHFAEVFVMPLKLGVCFFCLNFYICFYFFLMFFCTFILNSTTSLAFLCALIFLTRLPFVIADVISVPRFACVFGSKLSPKKSQSNEWNVPKLVCTHTNSIKCTRDGSKNENGSRIHKSRIILQQFRWKVDAHTQTYTMNPLRLWKFARVP